MQFDITDDLEESQPCQPLESILSVCVETIHRVKAVALHDNVCKASYDDSNFQQDANGVWGEIEGPQRDPTTGAIRIGQAPPWTIMPWTKQDLTECLNLWDTAIDLIEQGMSFPPLAHPTGLVDLANHEYLPIAEGLHDSSSCKQEHQGSALLRQVCVSRLPIPSRGSPSCLRSM